MTQSREISSGLFSASIWLFADYKVQGREKKCMSRLQNKPHNNGEVTVLEIRNFSGLKTKPSKDA